MVQSRLLDHLKQIDILVPEQFGFFAGHFLTHELMCFVETVANASCSQKQTVTIFLDINKAFNHVWYPGLLYRLIEILLLNC